MKRLQHLIITFAMVTCSLLSSTSQAAININALTKGSTIAPDVAKELLKGIYMHNPDLLNSVSVEVLESQLVNDVHLVELAVNSTVDGIAIEYYAVTLTPQGQLIDGALMGHGGDVAVLGLPGLDESVKYEPNPDIDIELKQDTIKVKRTYVFFSTLKGGRFFTKNGTIYNPFLISSNGTLVQLPVECFATNTTGDNNYLSEDHKRPVTVMDDGEYYLLGMAVLSLAQRPASAKIIFNSLNELATPMLNIMAHYDENAPMNPETLCVMEYARWSTNAALRSGNEFLTWMAEHHQEVKFTHFLVTALQENESNEAEWLIGQVRSLKNKKARKWWQNWLKKEANISTK